MSEEAMRAIQSSVPENTHENHCDSRADQNKVRFVTRTVYVDLRKAPPGRKSDLPLWTAGVATVDIAHRGHHLTERTTGHGGFHQ